MTDFQYLVRYGTVGTVGAIGAVRSPSRRTTCKQQDKRQSEVYYKEERTLEHFNLLKLQTDYCWGNIKFRFSPMDVYSWGCGECGQLGLGDERDRYEPTLLDTNTSDKLEWIQIECGGWHTVGLTKNGQVFSWGLHDYGQLGHGKEFDFMCCSIMCCPIRFKSLQSRIVPTKVAALDGIVIIKISCGAWHTAAVTDKGEILTWYVRS